MEKVPLKKRKQIPDHLRRNFRCALDEGMLIQLSIGTYNVALLKLWTPLYHDIWYNVYRKVKKYEKAK